MAGYIAAIPDLGLQSVVILFKSRKVTTCPSTRNPSGFKVSGHFQNGEDIMIFHLKLNGWYPQSYSKSWTTVLYRMFTRIYSVFYGSSVNIQPDV